MGEKLQNLKPREAKPFTRANEKFHLFPSSQKINSFFRSPSGFLLLNSGCSLEKEPKQTDFFQGVKLVPAPERWTKSCAHDECTLHRIPPYIGKIKSSIAGELVKTYSKPGDLVVDPFAGAGTIPLESTLQGRRAFGADISPYAQILSLAKLFPPRSLNDALKMAEDALRRLSSAPAGPANCSSLGQAIFSSRNFAGGAQFCRNRPAAWERISYGMLFGNPAPPAPGIFIFPKQPPCSLSPGQEIPT